MILPIIHHRARHHVIGTIIHTVSATSIPTHFAQTTCTIFARFYAISELRVRELMQLI
jgi:hypothetical protein